MSGNINFIYWHLSPFGSIQCCFSWLSHCIKVLSQEKGFYSWSGVLNPALIYVFFRGALSPPNHLWQKPPAAQTVVPPPLCPWLWPHSSCLTRSSHILLIITDCSQSVFLLISFSLFLHLLNFYSPVGFHFLFWVPLAKLGTFSSFMPFPMLIMFPSPFCFLWGQSRVMLCVYRFLGAVVCALCEHLLSVASGQSPSGPRDLFHSAQLIQRHSDWPLCVVN